MDKQKLKLFLKKYWKQILIVIYFFFPIDVIPDVLIPFGYTDDLILIVFAIADYIIAQRKFSSNEENIVDGEVVEEEK